jgi:type I restriction enzyme S subunit
MKKWKKISDYLFFQEGPGVRNHQYTSNGIKLLNVANLVNGRVDLTTSERYISNEEAYGKYKHFLADEGDLIIASSGIKVDYFDKKMGFIKKQHLPICMNTSTIRFKSLDKSKLDIYYFMYYLKSQSFKNQLSKQITGSAQLNFGPSHLKRMEFPIVDIVYQSSINSVLSNIESQISLKEEQLSAYDQLIKSRFVEMFGWCDLNKRQNNWFKLGDVTEIVTGTTPSTHIEENWNGKHLWITPAEIKDDSFYIYDTERKLSDIGLSSKSLRVMPINTVLLSTRAPIGKTAIVGKPMTCNQGFKNFICKDKLNPIFLYILLKFNKDYLNSIGSGTTFKEISKTVVSNIEIPVPPIELQNEFASFVIQVDKLKFEDVFLY